MKTARAIILALVIIGAAASGSAATSAKVHVSATVLPFVGLNAAQHVATFRVTRNDLQRGYVDIPAAISVSIRTNTGSDIRVGIESGGNERLLVREAGSQAFSESSFVVRTAAAPPGTMVTTSLDSRVVLTAESREGVYPLVIAMTPQP